MFDSLFQVAYLIGLILGSALRTWYGKRYRQDSKAIFREEGLVLGLLASLWGVAILMPLFRIFTEWMNFADYHLPTWAGGIGIITFVISLWLLWRSHADLGHNWRITTDVRENHKLVTSGVFRYMRHPMYSAHWLWGIAQVLLIQNWITGLATLVVFLPFYLLRINREEQMMLQQFGAEYRSYMKLTGRIIPRLFR